VKGVLCSVLWCFWSPLLYAESNVSSNVEKLASTLTPYPVAIDAGSVLQGELRQFSVKLKNNSVAGTQIISKVSASCSCLAPKVSQNVLNPRQTADLTFGLRAGPTEKSFKELIAIEYYNLTTKSVGTLAIPITGKVESVIEVNPRRLDFDQTSVAENKVVAISVRRGSSGLEWETLEVEHDLKDRIDIQIAQSGGAHQIRVSPRIDKLEYGLTTGQIVLKCLRIDGTEAFRDAIPLTMTRNQPLSADPSFFYLDDLTVGLKTTVTFKIIPKDTQTKLVFDNVIRFDSETCQITVERTRAEPGLEFKVEIVPVVTGLVKSTIVLPYTSDRPGKLLVPIVGVVRELDRQ
jgi:hypothetical protein